jgi:hypothetical protein
MEICKGLASCGHAANLISDSTGQDGELSAEASCTCGPGMRATGSPSTTLASTVPKTTVSFAWLMFHLQKVPWMQQHRLPDAGFPAHESGESHAPSIRTSIAFRNYFTKGTGLTLPWT